MFKEIVFYDNFTDLITGTWSTFLIQGIVLVCLGILILVYPEILVAMISTAFILLGALFIVVALKTRRLKRNYRTWREEFWEPL